ncbi:SGNH hydrolase domain-containing protein [Actinoplanes sp. NPDC048796]|uniref:SGNH hydrolase domain-containing protein n=1 Tax=Actinoplanes sp. NPDC048796 TaxID=3155640 RepID=UPI0034004DDD
MSRTDRLPILALAVVLLAGCTGAPPPRPRQAEAPAPRIALSHVLAAVREAPALRALPADLTPALATAPTDLGFDNDKCEAGPTADRIEPCVFGDRAAATDVVLYGDSHAGMWLPALSEIAERRHWRLQLFGKPACPAPAITFWNQQESRPFAECDRFRSFVASRIASVRPELVIVTSGSFSQKRGRGVLVTPGQWQTGLATTLRTLRRSAAQVVVLGDTPVLDQSGPECLSANVADISACATSRTAATARVWNAAEALAAREAGAGYVSVLPWLCTRICTPVIGNVTVYRNRFHLTGTYARMMNGVLEEALLEHFPQDAVP